MIFDPADSLLLRMRLRETHDAVDRQYRQLLRRHLVGAIVALAAWIISAVLQAISVALVGHFMPITYLQIVTGTALAAVGILHVMRYRALHRARQSKLYRRYAADFATHAVNSQDGYNPANMLAITLLNAHLRRDPDNTIAAFMAAIQRSTPRSALLLASALQMIAAADPTLFTKED